MRVSNAARVIPLKAAIGERQGSEFSAACVLEGGSFGGRARAMTPPATGGMAVSDVGQGADDARRRAVHGSWVVIGKLPVVRFATGGTAFG